MVDGRLESGGDPRESIGIRSTHPPDIRLRPTDRAGCRIGCPAASSRVSPGRQSDEEDGSRWSAEPTESLSPWRASAHREPQPEESLSPQRASVGESRVDSVRGDSHPQGISGKIPNSVLWIFQAPAKYTLCSFRGTLYKCPWFGVCRGDFPGKLTESGDRWKGAVAVREVQE
jgi:hypothetical protein